MFRSARIFQLPQKRIQKIHYNLLRSFSEANQKDSNKTETAKKESESVEIDPVKYCLMPKSNSLLESSTCL